MQEINLDMLDKIYSLREEKMEKETSKDREILNEKLNDIKIEDIETMIRQMSEKPNEIINKLELLIENYELQVSYYSEKNYKQGFKDAICLYTECIK